MLGVSSLRLASAAFALSVLGLGGGAISLRASPGRGSATAIPSVQARRIASECSGRRTYLPRWVPAGFQFSSWKVNVHNVLCDEGLTVHFQRGARALTWEAGGPLTFQLGCDGSTGSAVAHVNGRTIYRRSVRGREDVWACVRIGYPLILLATQDVASSAASSRDLERMVATAHQVPAGRARGARYELLPSSKIRAVANRFGAPLYLPRSLPGGFIFSEWSFRPHDFDTGGRDSLFVTFGRDGSTLDWSVLAGKDRYGIECPTKRTALSPKAFMVVHGVRIFLSVGIHGGSAWRCVPAKSVGNASPLEVSLWYSIGLDAPAMRRQVSEIVAEAQLVKRR